MKNINIKFNCKTLFTSKIKNTKRIFIPTLLINTEVLGVEGAGREGEMRPMKEERKTATIDCLTSLT